MELDPETRGYAPKDSAERQRYIKKDYYFKYNSKNYLFFNYLVLILRVSLVKINLIKINFYLFFLKEIFLNKLL